jgi:uncharacterized phage protein gp47/JayE
MASQSDIVTQMLAGLAVSLPALDASIGSPVRSIIDVVAEAVAEAYADQYILSYQYDIYSKSGADLDNYVAQFGFNRLPGVRATGSITFSRTSPATADIYIPAATQLADSSTPPNLFNTLTPVILAQGTTSCSVPVQANVAGTAGNVAASTIVNVTTNASGFSSVTNPSGLTGGADPESDDQLRGRFLSTVFRNMAGTEPMFLGVALEDPDVTKANVIGAQKTYNEIIQIVSGGALSSVQDFSYLYPGTSVLGVDIFNGDIVSPTGDYTLESVLVDPTTFGLAAVQGDSGLYPNFGTAHYSIVANTAAGSSLPCGQVTAATDGSSINSFSLTWSNPNPGAIVSWDIYFAENSTSVQYLTTVDGTATSYLDTGSITANGTPPAANNAWTPPYLAVLNDTVVPDGIYQLQYDYLPNCSRNDPLNGITNRVDIYVNNTRAVEVVQDTQWSDSLVFTHNSGDFYDVTNWSRFDGLPPAPGNFFIPLAFVPVLDYGEVFNGGSGTILIGTYTYLENVDYWGVNNTSAFGLSPLSLGGIEWLSTDSPIPSVGDAMTLTYDFNQIPQSVQAAIAAWSLVTTDVQVHQAKVLDLNVYLGLIMSTTTYSQATVLSQIEAALSNYFNSVTFDGVVQISEVISIVQNLPGVVAVRVLTSADDTSNTYPTNPQYDATNYAIQSVNVDNNVLSTYATYDGSVFRAIDIPLSDDTLAVLNNVYINFYAQNTFGSV